MPFPPWLNFPAAVRDIKNNPINFSYTFQKQALVPHTPPFSNSSQVLVRKKYLQNWMEMQIFAACPSEILTQ